MTYDEARNIAKSWCEAWTNRDLDAVMEHYAEDVKLSSPTVMKRLGIANGWIEGKRRLREHFSVGIQAPDLRFDFVDVLLGVGGMAVIYRRETGALVVDVVELDDKRKGKVVCAFYGESSQ
ncbi:MAG TPA: nuclear transport factor 2 family protein [Candidatus Binatia bacterium]|nr:nuclear transport factor 2 family protein [Candidatus Binatia bacterium]